MTRIRLRARFLLITYTPTLMLTRTMHAFWPPIASRSRQSSEHAGFGTFRRKAMTATNGKKIYEWDRNPRMPMPAPPAGSCDCQFHIYGDATRFPPRANAPYPPIESATFEQARRMQKAIGFARGGVVHSAIYGSDHRLLLHVLEGLNDPAHYRAIGILDDRVSESEAARLHAAGVRGSRFNFVRGFAMEQREADVRRSMARLRELGWHARLHVNGEDLMENSTRSEERRVGKECRSRRS